jgi:L-ascorbate metabolism protein UlaG (beta-lactamase superfamily)
MNIDGILIEAVPAYNIVKTNFHPKANNWVGYILTIDKIRIYHTGDTERIPEMKNMACDIILLPLGQTYTMNSVEEAAEATLDVKAKIAIPIHFGLYEGKAEDAQKFQALLKVKVKVIIKQKQ